MRDVVILLFRSEIRRFLRSLSGSSDSHALVIVVAAFIYVLIPVITYILLQFTSVESLLDYALVIELGIFTNAIFGILSVLMIGGDLWPGRLAYSASAVGMPAARTLITAGMLFLRQVPILFLLIIILLVISFEIMLPLLLLCLLLILSLVAVFVGLNMPLLGCVILGRWGVVSIVLNVSVSIATFAFVFQIAVRNRVGEFIVRSYETSGFLSDLSVLLITTGGTLLIGILGVTSVLLLARRPLTLDFVHAVPVKRITSPILWSGSRFVTLRLAATRLSRSPRVHSLVGFTSLVVVTWLVWLVWKPTPGAMWTAPILQVVSVCLGSAVFVSFGVKSGGRYPEILSFLGGQKLTIAYIQICLLVSIPILIGLLGVSVQLEDWTVFLGAIVLLSIALPGGALCGWILQPVVGSSISESSGVTILFALVLLIPLTIFGGLQSELLRYGIVVCVSIALLVSAIFLGEFRLSTSIRTRG